MTRLFKVALAVSALAAISPCQIGAGEVGLSMAKPSGSAGSLCSRTFSCTYLDTPVVRGETVTLAIRGVLGQPYAVLVGVNQSPLCLSIPGVHNSLMFAPAAVPFAGTLQNPDQILACPGGLETISFTVPMALNVGGQVVFQALAWSYLLPAGEVPTLTQAIRTTVQ